MKWQERFKRWFLDRRIVHVAILLWSAPAMYRTLIECQAYLGRSMGQDVMWRNRTVARVAETIWFSRGKWGKS